ncbi:ATP-grasp domain-containing protein [Rathayibacter toxicus]|uniref:ATP-grasp domain-containing protein n=1 Tax=Rathayibacter toxicus TaxID=145458 RepID=UPI001C05AFE6|nr:ATP-grasp domain-containing protein [Rathayibacter toxicus]QWL30355.1 ATP-grasp domain-containing protein [Rathayibacter toxicus]
MHTLLVISGKRHVSDLLLRNPELGALSVITEAGHPDLYSDIERTELVADINDYAEVFATASRIHDQHPIDHVLAPYETGLPAGAYVRTLLGLPGLDFRTAVAFSNKYVMKRIAQRAGLPVTAHALAGSVERAYEVAAEFNYPVVLKPLYGGGSSGVVMCDDDADIQTWWHQYCGSSRGRTAIVEKKVEIIEEFHIDALVVDATIRFVVVSRYLESMLASASRRAPYASYQFPPGYGPSDELAKLHQRTVEALGLTDGVTHMEAFRTRDGWCISEIACRPGGGGGVAAAILANHGVDLFAASIQMNIGRTPKKSIASTAPPGRFFGHTALAIKPGEVTRISTPDTFAALPEVVGVHLTAKKGDIFGNSFLSVSGAGFVQVTSETEAGVVAALRRVQDQHIIATRAHKPDDSS